MIESVETPLPEAKRGGLGELLADRWCLFGIGCVVVLTYSVCLTSTIAHSDDYMFVWDMLGDKGAIMKTVTPMGRAVAGVILTAGFLPVDSIERLWIPRLLSICGIVVLLGMLFATLRRLGYARYFAFTFAALVAVLPPFTLYAAWATACSMVYAAIAAVGAFSLAERAWAADPRAADSAQANCRTKPCFVRAANSWAPRVLQALLAVGLMVVALQIYQPTAMFYPVAMLFLLFSPAAFSREKWLRFAFHGAILILSLGLGFAVYLAYASSERGGFVQHFMGKTIWFIDQPFCGSLDLMFFPHEAGLAAQGLGVLETVLLAVLWFGLYLVLDGSPASRFARLAAACVLLPLTYLPNLVIEENWASYRTRGALAAAVLFLACCAVSGLTGRLRFGQGIVRALKPIALVAVLGIGAAVAQRHVVEYFVVPGQFEWRLVRQEMATLAADHPEPLEQVFFLMPNAELPIPESWEYDEFGHLAIARDWVPEPICGLALKEAAPDRLAAFRAASFTKVPLAQDAPISMDGRWIVNVRFINGLSDALYRKPANANPEFRWEDSPVFPERDKTYDIDE